MYLKEPSLLPDLFLFNLIAAIAALTALLAPKFNDPIGRISLALALAVWTLGSFTTTWNSLATPLFPSQISDICYSAFYPFLLLGLIRLLTARHHQRRQLKGEIIDTLIIGLGISGVCAGLLLKTAMENFEGSPLTVFLSIIYPIGDLVILAVTIALLALTRARLRSFLFLLGIAIFTVTDLYFLWQSALSVYQFGSISDDGWLLGIILIAESLWHQNGEAEISPKFNSIAAGLSIIASSIVLVIAALRPRYFPHFILFIACTTLLLAFLRLFIALKDARSIAEQRELARTDELTGLPNRRKFLADIESLHQREGTLMILDLDGFKRINDLHGHLIGDQLLRTIAQRFARAMPAHSQLARLGGDEFGAIIYGSESVGLESAFALRATLSYPVAVAALTLDAGVSIGRVFHPAGVEPVPREELLRRADEAMYEAKRERSGTALWVSP
jgi:diguanylate cyclase (GGDEF)-like protein